MYMLLLIYNLSTKSFYSPNPKRGQLKDSPRGSSVEGDSFGGPPFNPLVGPFGWPAFDPHMFTPPWYQPLVVQLVP
jgi:hypothetical protein